MGTNMIQERMKAMGVTQRDVAEVTGKPLSLICYVCQGLAHFQDVEDFKKLCELLKCKPTDLYSKKELRAFYPELLPKSPERARTSYGNPSVRVRADLVQVLKERGVDVAKFVNNAVETAIQNKAEKEEKDG